MLVGRMLRVIGGMELMGVSQVGVVGRLFMIAGLMMVSRFIVMVSGL
jgi:hypothetical protein